MKQNLIIALGLLLISLPPVIRAQASPDTGPTSAPSYNSATPYGPKDGDSEFTLGGDGSSDKRFNHEMGGVDFSLGKFTSDTGEILLRQTIDYGSKSSFSSRVAYDEHFLTGQFRPFLGVNLGYVYGSAVQDTLAAGLEAGFKYYVYPKTFVFALLDYSFLFRSSNQVQDRFNSGAFFMNVGVGFQF